MTTQEQRIQYLNIVYVLTEKSASNNYVNIQDIREELGLDSNEPITDDLLNKNLIQVVYGWEISLTEYGVKVVKDALEQEENITTSKAETPTHQSKFRDSLVDSFDRDELDRLMFDLDIRKDNISGDTIEVRATNLIDHCNRHGKFNTLVIRCSELRPHIKWAEL